MKRAIALLISAGVTAVILLVVLAVASPKTDPLTTGVNAAPGNPVVDPATLSDDPAVLQQQLQDAYTLLQQRDAAYQQRLQEAYNQLQAPQGEHDDDGYEAEHEDGDEGGEAEIKGVVEAMAGNLWTVGGRAVVIVPQTKVNGSIAIGDFVKVHGAMRDNNLLLAYEIEREND